MIDVNDKPCQLELLLNDFKVGFEVDTGSHLSTVNLNTFQKIPNVSMDETKIRAKAYCNSSIEFLGETNIDVIYNNVAIDEYQYQIVDLLLQGSCFQRSLNHVIQHTRACTEGLNVYLILYARRVNLLCSVRL